MPLPVSPSTTRQGASAVNEARASSRPLRCSKTGRERLTSLKGSPAALLGTFATFCILERWRTCSSPEDEPTSSPIDSTAAFARSRALPSTRTNVVGGAQGPCVTFFFDEVGADTDGAFEESGSCPYCKAALRNSGSLSGGIAPAAFGARPANPKPRERFRCFFEAICCLKAASPLQSAPQTPHLK